MSLFENRSLRKASDKLTSADERLLERFTCSADGCGKHFVFEITKDAHEQVEEKKRRYSGRCGFCGKQIKLTDRQYARWCSVVEGSELRIRDTTFDQLFRVT